MPEEILEIERLGDGVSLIDKELRIISWSLSAERITGYSQEQVLGKSCKEIFGSEFCEKAPQLRKVINTGESVSNTIVTIQTAEGIKIPTNINATPLKDVNGRITGVVLIFRNIAEIQTISSQLLKEKNRLHTILESIADGVFTVNTEWKITSFNRAAEKITGFKKEEVLGKECSIIFKTDVCKKECPLRRSIETGKPISDFEIEITSKEGKKIPISLSASSFTDEDGEIAGGVETFRDLSEIKYLSKELSERYKFSNIIGKSPKMQEIYSLLEAISETSSTVLILGETGTGKDLVAKAIHFNSPRKDKPFIKVLCATLPENLLESELFGYVKGAFTGAVKDKPGRFELADKGTIFLDEIGEISRSVQAKLLRVIEEGEFERLGSVKTTKVDVRIIAATNKNLKDMVKDGSFREDLYYRLNVIPIFLPPLRERKEDIPLLIDHFIKKFREKTGKKIEKVSQDAMDILIDYDWPGNVRELENAIEHSFVHCTGKIIQVQHLPKEVVGTAPTLVHSPPQREAIAKTFSLDEAERNVILKALQKNKWNRLKTAQELDISRTTLWRKMKKHSLLLYPTSFHI